jgi:murein DD-endopeptidase MepM/ murein hydrolase activator NlpD
MQDITQLLRTRKNNAKRVIRNTIEAPEDQRLLLNVLDNAFSDIVRGSTIFLSDKNEDAIVLNQESMVVVSDTLTEIINNFFAIENYHDYRYRLDKNRIDSSKAVGNESSMEQFKGGPDMAAPAAVPEASSAGGDVINVLSQQLPMLTQLFDKLHDALDNLGNLQSSSSGVDADLPTPGRRGSKPGAKPRLPMKTPKGPIPKSPYTLGGITGTLAIGYLGYKALTGGFGKGGPAEQGLDGASPGAPGGVLGPGQYAPVGDLSKVTGDWKNDKEFLSAVDGLAGKYNVDANDLLGLMYNESAGTMSPTVRGKNGATGLFQFMPQYFNTDAISKMTRAQQVAVADEKIFGASKMPRGANAGQIYAAVYLPSIARNQGWQGILSRKGHEYYDKNKGLDVDQNGVIDYNDLAKKISGHRVRMGLGPSPSLTNTQGYGGMLVNQPGLVNNQGWTNPLGDTKSVTVSGGQYGASRDYGAHQGRDLAAPAGTPVRAVLDGRIEQSGYSGSNGGMRVSVLHDAKTGLLTKYMHLAPEGMPALGRQIKRGDIIGYIGKTGLKTTGRGSGDHLHFEVQVGGRNVNPEPYIRGTTGQAVSTASTTRPTSGRGTPLEKYTADQQKMQAGQWAGFPYAAPAKSPGSSSGKSNANPAQQYRKHFGT